jgi:replicative DNA helicase
MALLYDQDSELRCLKTLTEETIPSRIRSTLLGKLNKDHFYNAPTLAAFVRLDTLARKRFEIVDINSLVADPVIDEDLRDILKTQLRKCKPCKSKKSIDDLLDILERYRKIRAIYTIAKDSFEELEKPEVDVDKLLHSVTSAVARANASMVEEEFFLNFGHNDSSEGIVEKILTKQTSSRIKTGYTEYDNRNGGLPESGVMIIASTTSGGKSALAMNLGVSLYEKSKRSVLRISLEMDDTQETRRLASHLTQIQFNKFKNGTLSIAEKTRVRERFKKFRAHGIKHEIAYTTVSPRRGMTADDVFRMVKAYRYKIVMIDYIGLLKGMSHDDQWFNLSEIAATSKIFSRETDSLVVILAQLDDTSEKLRYSRGIKEHADTVWQWNYSKPEQRELRILPVRCEKDRDGEIFNFELAERYDIMTAENMPDAANSYEASDTDDPYGEDDNYEGKKSKKSKNKKDKKSKKGSKKRKSSENGIDDEADDYALA